MTCNIVSSSSKGNCIIVNNYLMLDCGVSYKKIEDFMEDIKIIFISHEHKDHLNPTAIKKIAYEKPNIKFLVGNYLIPKLIDLGVSKKNIITFDLDKWYNIGIFKAKMQYLMHDVPNNCLHIEFKNGEKLFYAVDTSSIDHIEAKNYDLYLIEGNYEEEILEQHIKETLQGEDNKKNLQYLLRVPNTHLSSLQATNFLVNNMTDKSKCYLIHQSSYNYKQ